MPKQEESGEANVLVQLLRALWVGLLCFGCVSANAETSLFIHSQPGHAVASGRSLLVRPADGYAFTVSKEVLRGSISVEVIGDGSNPSLGAYWVLYIAGPNLTMPTVGSYENAANVNGLGGSKPALSFSGDGIADGGSFKVIEIETDVSGNIVKLAVDFIIAGPIRTNPRLFGQLRFNSDVAVDTTIRIPDPYRFVDALDSPPGQVITSAPVAINGLSLPVPISIAGGEYSIDNGPFTSATGTAQSGQSVQVMAQAPNIPNAVTVARLTVGAYFDDFNVGTPTGIAPQPHGEPLIVKKFSNSVNPVPIERIFSPAADYDIVMTGGSQLTISEAPNGNVWSLIYSAFRGPGSSSPPISAGEYFPASMFEPDTSLPAFYSSLVSCSTNSSMRIHEVEYLPDGTPTKFAADVRIRCEGDANDDIFYRIGSTVPIDYNLSWPLPINFVTVTDATPGTQVYSSEIVIGGINVTLPISITGGEYSIDAGPYTSVPGTVANLQRIRVRTFAPATENDIKTLTLTVGARMGQFVVASKTGVPQPNGRPMVVVYDQALMQGGLPTIYSDATLVQVRLAASANPVGTIVEVYDPKYYGGSVRDSLRLAVVNQPNLTVGEFPLDGANPAASVFGGGSLTLRGQGLSSSLCDTGDGSVLRILEVGYAPDGQPIALAADIVLRCKNSTTTNYLYIRVGSTIPIDYRVTRPFPFGFKPVANVPLGTMATSEETYLRGINTPTTITVENGEYSIDGGPFTNAPGVMSNLQRIRLRGLAPPFPARYSTVRVNVGGQAANFRIGTAVGLRPQPTGDPLLVLIKKSQLSIAAGTTVLTPANGQDFFLSDPNPELSTSPRWLRLTAGLKLPDYQQESQFVFTLGTPPFPQVVPGFYPGLLPDTGSTSSTIRLCTPDRYSGVALAESWVHVYEVTYDPIGTPTSLAMDFATWCEGMTEATYGYVRVNSNVPIDYVIADPFPLYPGKVGGAVPSAMVSSNTVTVSGINTTVPISISNGEYRIGNGDWTTAPGVVSDGSTITVRTQAPALENRLKTAELTVNTRVAQFTVGTRPGWNPQPSAGINVFVTISQPGEPLGNGTNQVFSSALLDTIRASNSGVSSILISTYPWSSNSGNLNAQISYEARSKLQVGEYNVALGTSSQPRFQYGKCNFSQVSGTLRVHEAQYDETGVITSLAFDFVQYCNGALEPMYGYVRINSSIPIQQFADDLPSPFAFNPYTYAPANTQVLSGYPLTINNANAVMPIAVSDGEYKVDDGPFTSANGTINPGQSLQLRLRSSAIPGRTTSMTVNVGKATALFLVTTSTDAVPPAGLPGSPNLLGGAAGDGSVTLHFRPPYESGGFASLEYLISCNGDSGVFAGTASPVTRTGLVNGLRYDCNVIARNANGLGGASQSYSLTPSADAPLVCVGIVSRKTHGNAGQFDLPISWSSILENMTVEPREAGDGHELIFFFNRPIISVGSATVVDQNLIDLGNAITTKSGNSVVVKLPAIADRRRAKVVLTGTNGGTQGLVISLGFLIGDVNGSRAVNVVDIIATKRRAGQTVSYVNFLSDIDTSGAIDTVDTSLVKGSSGTRLP